MDGCSGGDVDECNTVEWVGGGVGECSTVEWVGGKVVVWVGLIV